MTVEEILDTLDEMLEKGLSLPFSGGKTVIDNEKIGELLDEIRINLPLELKTSKQIIQERNEIIANAKREADAIVRRAEDRARALIAQEEIVKQAQQRVNEMVTKAQQKAKELRTASQDFSDDLLKQTEETLAKHLGEVRSTRQAMRSAMRK